MGFTLHQIGFILDKTTKYQKQRGVFSPRREARSKLPMVDRGPSPELTGWRAEEEIKDVQVGEGGSFLIKNLSPSH